VPHAGGVPAARRRDRDRRGGVRLAEAPRGRRGGTAPEDLPAGPADRHGRRADPAARPAPAGPAHRHDPGDTRL
jgi:hypothetical protein